MTLQPFINMETKTNKRTRKNPQCTNSDGILSPQTQIHTNYISSINGSTMDITDSAPFAQLFSEPASNSGKDDQKEVCLLERTPERSWPDNLPG